MSTHSENRVDHQKLCVICQSGRICAYDVVLADTESRHAPNCRCTELWRDCQDENGATQ